MTLLNATISSTLKSKKSVAVFLFLLLFIAYNSNLKASNTVDALPNTLLPVSILKYADFNLNEFENLFDPQPKLWKAGFIFGAIQTNDKNIISSYPVGTAIMATPFYAVARILNILKPTEWQSYRLTAKLTASSMVAFSAAILYLSLASFLSNSTAIWLTLAYGLGTGAFSIASQGLWQHGPGMLCLSIAILCMLKLENKQSKPILTTVTLGAALSMAVICRSQNLIPAIAISLYILSHHRKLILYFIPLPLLSAAWLAHFNLNSYGNLLGGYDAIIGSKWHSSRNLLETGLFKHNLFYGLASTWLSPSKGVLIYSPFLLSAIIAPFFLISHSRIRLLLPIYIWIVASSIMYAKNSLWWGGTSYGPRYFLEMSLALVLLIGLAYPHFNRTMITISRCLITLSICIHTIGAFYAPCGWAESPNIADFNPARHWDWSDMEISRCIRKGIKDGPLPSEFTLN